MTIPQIINERKCGWQEAKRIQEQFVGYELKPCPFCGHAAKLHLSHPSDYFISCSNRECEIEPSTEFKATEEDAIKVWNNRP